jgi:hypothetical protein
LTLIIELDAWNIRQRVFAAEAERFRSGAWETARPILFWVSQRVP